MVRKTKTIGVCLEFDLLEQVSKKANDQKRSLSNMLNLLVRSGLKKG